jgi:Contractile injection system tube protein
MGKLRITKCNVSQSGMIDLETGTYFETSINPANLKTGLSISYTGAGADDNVPLGAAGASPKYKFTNAEDLNFEIVLDGTGVVPGTANLTVADQITKLKSIAYHYDGSKHEPSVVQVAWGDGGIEAFTGRLLSLGIDYTLFRPSGEALRAKVSLSFKSFNSIEEINRAANKTSPDLTHIVLVRAGDTLPLLCERIYKDPSKYLAVARHNRLDSFRALKPGTELHFPPMR